MPTMKELGPKSSNSSHRCCHEVAQGKGLGSLEGGVPAGGVPAIVEI
ncbi:MAG: hypothetical protein FWD73_04240 [Polyangiaceae bacterium]|nr:hypothetical protein [Polyangiaceae bacterium]